MTLPSTPSCSKDRDFPSLADALARASAALTRPLEKNRLWAGTGSDSFSPSPFSKQSRPRPRSSHLPSFPVLQHLPTKQIGKPAPPRLFSLALLGPSPQHPSKFPRAIPLQLSLHSSLAPHRAAHSPPATDTAYVQPRPGPVARHNHLYASITAHLSSTSHSPRPRRSSTGRRFHPPARCCHCHSASHRLHHCTNTNAILATSSFFMTFPRLGGLYENTIFSSVVQPPWPTNALCV